MRPHIILQGITGTNANRFKSIILHHYYLSQIDCEATDISNQ